MISRILRRSIPIVLALAVLAALLAVGAYYLVARSLPQLDGRIPVQGILHAARIERDAAGIATITADNRNDLAYATGFAHGQDRFFQMDLTRRSAAGELSEIFGSVALSVDRKKRWHRFRSRAQQFIKQASDADKDLLEAYARGVNDGLGNLESRPFEYFIVDSDPTPWRPEDTMLVAYAMYLTLNDDRAASDVGRGLAHAVFPTEVYDWIYPTGTPWDAPLTGDAVGARAIPGAEIIDYSGSGSSLAHNVFYPEGPIAGSNNWAVSGKLTSTGRAIVANDMHLQITVPGIFYRVRLIVNDELDVTGLSLPGTPLVVAGSNGKVAWGFTNSYGDWSDAVLLKLAPGGNAYLTASGAKDFDLIEETINVKDAPPEVLSIRETVWGPVLDDGSYPEGDIAVSWIAHDVNGINLNHVQLEKVASVAEALSVANTLGMPPQNFVCGDADGNIGWTIAGRIPRRRDYDGRLPVDWSDGDGWDGWLLPEEYPRIVNPESGRIWTANARVVDDEALHKIGYGNYALGARASQIRDGLFARQSFEPVDMLAIQNDDRAIFLEPWRELLLQELKRRASRDPLVQTYERLVEDWVARASVDSVGYRLVQGFRLQVRSSVFEMLMAPVRERYGPNVALHLDRQFEGPLWQLLTEQPANMLSAEFEDWHALMMAAVDAQIASLQQVAGDGLEHRTWGEQNTAAIRHPLSRAVPLLASWLDMKSEPLSGDTHMPKALGPDFGASERFAVAPGDEHNAYMHIPAGQSGHPMSDYYRMGHDDWVQVRPSPFLPGKTAHSLILDPESL